MGKVDGAARGPSAEGEPIELFAEDLSLQLSPGGVEGAWVVRKPGQGRVATSLELYDASPSSIAAPEARTSSGSSSWVRPAKARFVSDPSRVTGPPSAPFTTGRPWLAFAAHRGRLG